MVGVKNKNMVLLGRYVIIVWLLLFVRFCVQAQPQDTIRFIHITDPHICFLDDFHPVIQEKRSHYGEGVEALEGFLDTFSRNPAIDFISITGDMIDFYQAVSSDLALLGNQIQQFIPILERSRVPVYMNLGNHDIATYFVEDNEPKSIQYGFKYTANEARAAWIRKADCFEHGTYYNQIRQVGSTTYRLIFLDNGYYDENKLESEQLEWLDWQLSQSPDDVEIIFMHVPYGHDQKHEVEGQQFFDVLMRYHSAKLILAGHEHVNDVHSFQSAKNDQLIQVKTGAFGRDPNNWRLVELTESGIKVSQPGTEANEILIHN